MNEIKTNILSSLYSGAKQFNELFCDSQAVNNTDFQNAVRELIDDNKIYCKYACGGYYYLLTNK